MRVVISQSMLFPWVGLLEQVRLAEVFVHYDDVQFSKGSFTNRVQIKTPEGMRWMTVPLEAVRLGQRIDEVRPTPTARWRAAHLDLLARSFKTAPHAQDALQLAEAVYATEHADLGSLARASLMALVRYFGLDAGTRFVDVVEMDVPGSSSERVIEVLRSLGGKAYITGHGASQYLDHEGIEAIGAQVQYMDYQRRAYPQSHGEFSPYVSALDLVAHCGREGERFIGSGTVGWRAFVAARQAA